MNDIIKIGNLEFLVLPVYAMGHYTVDRPHVVISITDPGKSVVNLPDNEHRLGVLRLSFNDAKEDLGVMRKMTMEQGHQLVDFVRQHQKHNPVYVVHCTVGVSRSPAIAAAIAAMHGENILKFWEMFLPNGHVFSNILICNSLANRSLKSEPMELF